MNVLVSITIAEISAAIPDYPHPSSIATTLPVFLIDLTIVSLSNGLRDLRLITSQLTPSFYISDAASKACLTILEKATKVT